MNRLDFLDAYSTLLDFFPEFLCIHAHRQVHKQSCLLFVFYWYFIFRPLSCLFKILFYTFKILVNRRKLSD